MRRIARDLSARGYRVVNLPFDSRRESIDRLADLLADRVARYAPPGPGRVHFVTHSMGAIVVRQYLARQAPPNLGRVVMLSPPNGGCEVVDLLRRVPILRDHLGPSRGALGTGPGDAPGRLGPVDYEVGVIAGGRSWNPLFSWILPGPDDGVVAVERMRVEGMHELRVVPRCHSFIMNGRDTIALTAGFLAAGTFGPPSRAL
jgi:pimeloyl-ACP methyl ester carboxylesterase